MIKWLCSLFRAPIPRKVVVVGYAEADRMLKADEGWRIAPEEDHNPSREWVWLERDVTTATGHA